MPDLIIKPTTTSGNKLILQDQAGGAVLTTADSGATLGNSTQDNITRLGTVATGTYNATIGTSATGFGLVEKVSWLRLEANCTNNPHDAVPSWDIQHGSTANIGSTVSESSGIFTFPATGMWLIILNASYYSNNAIRKYVETKIIVTRDNSSYTANCRSFTSIYRDSETWYGNSTLSYLFDVEDVSTHKMKIGFEGTPGSDFTMVGSGDTEANSTSNVVFIRLGAT